MNTPIQDPRSNMLVGLPYPADEGEFQRRWVAKFRSMPVAAVTPPSGDAQKKSAALAKFLEIVAQLHRDGKTSYSEAFREAASTEPGKTYYETSSMRGTDENLASSGPIPASAPATERYDPLLLEQAKKAFVDLTEGLARDGRFNDRATLWSHASQVHPEGKRLFANWKEQERLKQKDLLAKDVKFHPSSIHSIEHGLG